MLTTVLFGVNLGLCTALIAPNQGLRVIVAGRTPFLAMTVAAWASLQAFRWNVAGNVCQNAGPIKNVVMTAVGEAAGSATQTASAAQTGHASQLWPAFLAASTTNFTDLFLVVMALH
jgi:hypothetical protein